MDEYVRMDGHPMILLLPSSSLTRAARISPLRRQYPFRAQLLLPLDAAILVAKVAEASGHGQIAIDPAGAHKASVLLHPI